MSFETLAPTELDPIPVEPEIDFTPEVRNPQHGIPSNYESRHSNWTPQELELFDKYWAKAHVATSRKHSPKDGFAEREMIFSDATLGLVKGVRDFDEEKKSERAIDGSSYFSGKIEGEISRGRRDRMGRENDRTARVKPSTIYGSALSLAGPAQPGNPDSETELHEVLDPAPSRMSDFEISENRLSINGIIRAYPARDREIFFRSFYMGETQTEISKAIGISQMHVSRRLRTMLAAVDNQLGEQVAA